MVATHFWESHQGWILNFIQDGMVSLLVLDLLSQSSSYYYVQEILIIRG
jgi:hypothetical protein